MQDRSSRLHVSPQRTAPAIQLGVKVLRFQNWTGAQIATAVGISAATASRILRRSGLSRRGRLTPPLLVQRYEHARPGDLLHLDTKKLGRVRGLGHRITGQRRFQTQGRPSEDDARTATKLACLTSGFPRISQMFPSDPGEVLANDRIVAPGH